MAANATGFAPEYCFGAAERKISLYLQGAARAHNSAVIQLKVWVETYPKFTCGLFRFSELSAPMNSLIQMQAVMEAPYYEGEFLCPWPIPEFKPFSMIRLCGEMTYPEIGLVFAQLAKYNQIELANDQQAVLEQILEAEGLVLPGGIQIVSEEKVIPSSCCCGLEIWCEWLDFLKTGNSPWLGHDPSPWVESQGNVIRVWSDGGIEPSKNAFYVDVSRPDFKRALMLVERELQAFLFSIESWAQDIGFAEANELFQKFDHCFKIGRQHTEV